MTLLSISRPRALSNFNRNENYNSFMRGFSNAANNYVRESMTQPAVNIIEEPNNFILQLAAPGFSKKEIDVQVEKDLLTISASPEENGNNENHFIVKEFSKIPFKRTFTLGKSVDSSRIEANYNDGLLTLRIAKKEDAIEKPARKISVG